METWTIRHVIEWATDDLRRRGSASPRLDAELLLASAIGADRVTLFIDAERPLRGDELTAYKSLHRRRRLGEPVAYLRGYREFYSRTFVVDARVLVPRPETEILVDVSIRRSRHRSLSARVLDLCTGCGCVAITLARARPTTQVMASDVSRGALAVARDNCERLGALVGLMHSDLFDAFAHGDSHFEVITANPPYISEAEHPQLPADVRDFEPKLALLAGEDGMAITRRIIAEAPAFLSRDGLLALETAAGGAGKVTQLMQQRGFRKIEVDCDYAGHERVVSALAPPSQG